MHIKQPSCVLIWLMNYLPDLALVSERVSQRIVQLSLVEHADVDGSIEQTSLKSHHFI